MQPTYSDEAEAYREKVQAFLAEKLPSNWQGMGALEGDAIVDFVTSAQFGSGALAGVSAVGNFLAGAVLLVTVLYFFLKD